MCILNKRCINETCDYWSKNTNTLIELLKKYSQKSELRNNNKPKRD